jgi:hypothetical protein
MRRNAESPSLVKLVQLPDLSTLMTQDAGRLLVEFGAGSDWAALGRMWRMALAMAVRDGASSVHYHPWRADGHLSYIVSRTRYVLVQPPQELARRAAAAAGALACGGRLKTALRRWLGWPLRAAGNVRLVTGVATSDWAGVVWSVGSLCGVEWYRLDPPGSQENAMNAPATARPQPPDDSWLTREFFENRDKFPQEELIKYAGKHIAWSWDGASIVASADDREGLDKAIKSLGLSTSRVVCSYVDSGNEFWA